MTANTQAVGDELLCKLLVEKTAPEAVAYIKANCHKHLECYKLGGDAWLATITTRAGLARGATSQTGNVIAASFKPGVNPT